MTEYSNEHGQVFVKRRAFLRPVYLPLALAFLGLALSIFVRSWQTRWLSFSGLLIYGLGTVYFLVQALGRVCLRQWKWSFFAFARFILCLVALLPAAFLSLALAFGGPSEDGFADELSIPENVDLREPSEGSAGDRSADSFQATLLSSLEKTPTEDRTITPSIPSLRLLSQTKRPLLLRYLASSASWRVLEEHGKTFATRRWKTNGNWEWSHNGSYSSWDLGGNNEDKNYFQFRTTLILDRALDRTLRNSTRIAEGTNLAQVGLTKENNADASRCLIDCGGILLEVVEQTRGLERRLTKAAIRALEDEFAAVLRAETWSSQLLSPDSTRQGASSLELSNGMQPGIYNVIAWLNPGETGTVYLRAYEMTRNVRLSESRLFDRSNEQIGWSERETEQFLYNTEVTIYEGDWGKPYAARFELWFRPASGGDERELIQGNFKIEGWQR